jgi:1,2-diacylglycerol 3-alpha-glucosyltransferase
MHQVLEDKLRIGLFNDSFPPILDGVALAVKNYAYWMHQKGHKASVITLKAPNSDDSELPYPVYRYNSIPVIGRKPYRIGLPKTDLTFKADFELLTFDLLHAHSPFSAGNIALNLAKKRNIPLVATFHSKYQDDFERSVHNKQLAKLMVKEVICFYEKADEVWIPQKAVEETIRKYGYKGKVEVVENGNDLAGNELNEGLRHHVRKKLHLSDQENVFIFVGQHIWEKNTRLIIETLALLEDVPFKMYFIGTGYAENELKQLSLDLGLANKVEFLGMILDRELLKNYFACADLLLFPSIYDNAPLVVREAAAMGTPSVLVKESTAAEIIQDSINGFLIDNNSDSFASKLRQLSRNKSLINQVGKSASQTLARSWENITEEVLDRYNHIIKRHANRH